MIFTRGEIKLQPTPNIDPEYRSVKSRFVNSANKFKFINYYVSTTVNWKYCRRDDSIQPVITSTIHQGVLNYHD